MKRKIIAATMATAMLLSMAAPTAYAEDIVVGATAVEAAAPAETEAAAPAAEAPETTEAAADTYDAADVPVNEETFPDATFRQYVLDNFDKDKNNSLSAEEIAEVKYIKFWGANKIASLKGVEYFAALTSLKCDNNQLASLDVSKNTALIELYCYDKVKS